MSQSAGMTVLNDPGRVQSVSRRKQTVDLTNFRVNRRERKVSARVDRENVLLTVRFGFARGPHLPHIRPQPAAVNMIHPDLAPLAEAA